VISFLAESGKSRVEVLSLNTLIKEKKVCHKLKAESDKSIQTNLEKLQLQTTLCAQLK
jgi:hypothetical protein